MFEYKWRWGGIIYGHTGRLHRRWWGIIYGTMGTFESLHLHDFSSRKLKLFLFFVDEGNVIIWLCVSKFSFIGYIRIFAKKSYDFFVRVLPGGDFDYFLFSSRTLEKWSNLTSIFFEWVETINLSIATPWKINGWNLQITHEKKGTWSSKPLWLCSMLIGIPQNGWLIMENPYEQMDDLGGFNPLFWETSIKINR